MTLGHITLSVYLHYVYMPEHVSWNKHIPVAVKTVD